MTKTADCGWRGGYRLPGAGTRRCRRRGFTLLEVLVALALLAVTLAGALRIAAQNAKDIGYLRDKTFAQWVGLNEIQRRRLAPTWPKPGVTRGSEWMGEREWSWELGVTQTGDPNMRRLEVLVGDSSEPLARLTGYVLGPLTPPQPVRQ